MKPITKYIAEEKYIPRVFDALKDIAMEVMKTTRPIMIIIQEASKSHIQEKKYHAMIGDIAKQVEVDGRYYPLKVWKAKLVDQYEFDLLSDSTQQKLTHPSQVVTSIDGLRVVSIRASTTKFKKREASGFIEYIYSVGSDLGVKWSDPALRVYEEYREAHRK